jgi:hypothetical protein
MTIGEMGLIPEAATIAHGPDLPLDLEIFRKPTMIASNIDHRLITSLSSTAASLNQLQDILPVVVEQSGRGERAFGCSESGLSF